MQKKTDIYVPKFIHYVLVLPIFVVVRLLIASIRFKCDKNVRDICSRPDRLVGIAWHKNIIFLAKAKSYFRPNFNMAGLVSASKDAAYLVAFFNLMNIRSVRGSYMRRGREAILDLVDELKSDCDAFITPDGPRGPANVAKRGFYAVSKAAGVRVAFLRFKPSRYVEVSSWDKFVIPLPFSSVDVEVIEFENTDALDVVASEKNKTPEQFATDYMNFVD